MASAPALCSQAHGCLLAGADGVLLSSSSRDSLSARKNISVPLLSSCDSTARGRSSRHHLLLITAAQDKKGTRIFKFGGKKDTSEAADAGVSGTRKFSLGFGKKSASEAESESEEPKFGTKLFSFGGKKETGTVKGGSIVLKKESTALMFARPRRQDPNAVFVAGATGQTGARIAQKLLRQGFSIRGGVRDLYVAQQLAEFATQYGVISREEAKRLNAVEFDFKDVESIAKAIGGATKVVVTIGPTENGPKSKVSFEDASNVVEAAKLANVSTVVVVYEPGTALSGEGPLAGLTSFFSELFSKPDALAFSELINQIVDSELSYTLLKTSPTDGVDDFSPQAQNIVMLKEGTPTEGKISKSQLALIVAEVFSNTSVAENKIIEVSTSPSAAASSIELLLSAIPTDGRRAALAAAQAKAAEEEREKQAREQLEAESRTAVEEARKATLLAAQLEAEAKQLEAKEVRAATLAEQAQAQAAAAAASVDDLTSKAKELGTDFLNMSKAVPSLSFSLPSFSPSSTKGIPKSKPAQSLPKKKLEPALPSPVASVPASKPQINTIFGGLFSQETVYVDEA